MARPRTGQLRKRVRKDGTTKYSARVVADGNRVTVPLGDERDGMTPLMAEAALERLLKEIRLAVPGSRPSRALRSRRSGLSRSSRRPRPSSSS
jgi:hypothetical protein